MTQARNKLVKELAPGIWVDAEGSGHVSILDVLRHHGIQDTPENREAATQMMTELLANLNTSTVIRRTGACPFCPGPVSRSTLKIVNDYRGDYQCLKCGAYLDETQIRHKDS